MPDTVALTDLWLPIVVSAAAVFLASSLIWMVLQWHNKDWKGLPDEAAFLETLGKQTRGPGQFVFPWCASMKDMGEPGFQEKYAEGPSGMMVIRPPGAYGMGRQLGLWFLYCLVIGLFAGYIGSVALGPGEDYLRVFRVVGTAAVVAYAGALAPQAIWWSRTWGSILKEIVDGVIYGLVTAGVFGAFWPSGG